MGSVRSPALFAVALAGLLLGGCARQESHTQTTTTTTTEQRAASNPSDFPLYPNSVVATIVPVSSEQMIAAIRANDPHADVPRHFRGHEIIAETGASMDQLAAWLEGLSKTPPRGLRHVSDKHFNLSAGTKNEREVRVGAEFESADGGRSVYVVVADPRRIKEAMGPAFALIDSYSSLPGVMRGPIDDQAKKQVGYSVSEMLDAKSPAGAAIATVKRLQSADRRAILVIDESKVR